MNDEPVGRRFSIVADIGRVVYLSGLFLLVHFLANSRTLQWVVVGTIGFGLLWLLRSVLLRTSWAGAPTAYVAATFDALSVGLLLYITGIFRSVVLPVSLGMIAYAAAGSPLRRQGLYMAVSFPLVLCVLYVLRTVGVIPSFDILSRGATAIWHIVLVPTIYIVTVGVVYFQIRDIRNSKDRLAAAVEEERSRSENLLLNILPQSIADRLKSGSGTIADYHEQASVLFADIVGFTEMSARMSADSVVKVLNDLFSVFDSLTEKHRLEKIKTIGDAYMVAAGVPTPIARHEEKIVELALEMLEATRQYNESANQDVQVRIGICSGPAVAGVIGKRKFIYDVWGDTVNTASRMESTGLAGAVQVSASTYDATKSMFNFESRGHISVKGKGEVATYLLRGV